MIQTVSTAFWATLYDSRDEPPASPGSPARATWENLWDRHSTPFGSSRDLPGHLPPRLTVKLHGVLFYLCRVFPGLLEQTVSWSTEKPSVGKG